MKKVLITGANSYVGVSFEQYIEEYYFDKIRVDTVDMLDADWRQKNFLGYDTVFHVAGLAHADVSEVSEEKKVLYYKVNRDLAVETAEKCKREGVKQFIFMSSLIIYGPSAGIGKRKVITRDTEPNPENFYGDSKWQADQAVRQLNDDSFHVSVLRTPMIYGKGSKGNYPLLARIAKITPIFPDVINERSMIHIDNLCEFLCLLTLSGESGIFFPQNEKFVQTSELVKEVANVVGHNMLLTKLLNPFVWLAGKIPGKISALVNKAFGSIVYDLKISEDFAGKYRVRDFKESIIQTEGKS